MVLVTLQSGVLAKFYLISFQKSMHLRYREGPNKALHLRVVFEITKMDRRRTEPLRPNLPSVTCISNRP